MFPGAEAGFMEPEPGEITSADMMARAMGNPAVQWPKVCGTHIKINFLFVIIWVYRDISIQLIVLFAL